ncbi:hypothetical protein KBY24_00675 [Ruegeria pomeroyi]|uniref:Cold shock protein, CspA family n=1 Tax=Ruegeria alba TaxID=2916756 RepID=A0ABS9P1T0_9RHOB|nr:hypothetical protein [Ruegeria alba]MCE8511075.1 hypothetical protein [Ruegeria pomeroyi]MCE8519487.1 hypothetical protein [Ruegeria pomeroyi]MCE8524380.1 hypothetical protein [Ruegeria pomeroyi]MCE8528284.1 hypothetical protein [Ruegeria pomeroyi]MCE8531887.1 hypothetical protein [Ruegeria pomeroyi]
MLGVVLWSDRDDQKAVIWCEDHGDLAFYRKTDAQASVSLDVGDWVQFDLVTERKQRLALNPRLIDQGSYRGLPDLLRTTGEEKAGNTAPDRSVAKVIPFAGFALRKRDRQAEGEACHA